MANCLDSTGHSRSPPHKQLQQTATTTLQCPWVCHSGCKQPSIRSFQTLGPLDAWVTNRFRGAGTSKAQGQLSSSPVWGGKHKDSVEQEARRNEGLAGGWGRRVGYESRDCWGCQQHINTHLTAGGDLPAQFLPTFFAFPIICWCLILKLVNSIEERKGVCARRESCRMSTMQNWCPCLQNSSII